MLKKLRTGIDWLRSPYEFLDHALESGELTFRLNLPVIGKSVITGDPACIAEIVRDKNLIGGRGTQALRPVVGDHSLIVLEGATHEYYRNLMLPHFFTGDIARYDSVTRKWVQRILETQSLRAPFSGMKLTAEMTLNIILELLFGTLPAKTHTYAVELVKKWLSSFTNPAVLFLKPLQVNLGSRSSWGRFLANRHALHRFIQDQLDGRAAGGVLGTLIEQRQQGKIRVSDEELISQLVTFLLFGHDTSAAAMGWFFQYMWSDASALENVRQEVLRSNKENKGATPDPEHLILLRSAIQESMRLSPVVVHLTRHAIAPSQIGAFAIAKGERALPCMYLAHRNPAVFEHPTRFIPQRFVAPKPEWRHAYFPFGLGNRLCAGMPFALRQMVLITSELISSCTLELISPETVRPVRNMVLIVPSGGPAMRRVA